MRGNAYSTTTKAIVRGTPSVLVELELTIGWVQNGLWVRVIGCESYSKVEPMFRIVEYVIRREELVVDST